MVPISPCTSDSALVPFSAFHRLAFRPMPAAHDVGAQVAAAGQMSFHRGTDVAPIELIDPNGGNICQIRVALDVVFRERGQRKVKVIPCAAALMIVLAISCGRTGEPSSLVKVAPIGTPSPI